MRGNDVGGRGQPLAQDPGSAYAGDPLAVRLGRLARELQKENDSDKLLAAMVRTALQLVPGTDEASISIVTNRREVRSRAWSSDLPRRAAALQTQLGEGPCLDAVYDERMVRVPDMNQEQRWPRFAESMREAGVGSMLSFQLYVEDDTLGALNLYAGVPGAFSAESEHVGLLVAVHAAVAFADILKMEQLDEALSTRDTIGQAKGILIERYKITGRQAFEMLSKASQNTNRKLRDVAEELVSTGQLPGGKG